MQGVQRGHQCGLSPHRLSAFRNAGVPSNRTDKRNEEAPAGTAADSEPAYRLSGLI